MGPASPDAILELLEESAAFDDGEAVDLLAHALQCATILADEAPADLELQVAGLVHDLGHLGHLGLAGLPADDSQHASAGAALVAPVFGDRVAFLVRHHADAKRYLVDSDPAYAAELSLRSRESLGHQGGPLSDAERSMLESSRNIDALLALRRADDRAKVPGANARGLFSWLPVMRTIARHLDD